MAGQLDLELRVERALAGPRWTITDHSLHRMFEDSTAEAERVSLRRGMRAAVACFISFGTFDVWLFDDVGLHSLLVRAAVGLFFLALVELQFLRGSPVRTLNITCATSLATAALAWLVVAEQTIYQSYFGHFMVFGTIFVISSSLFFRFGLTISAICSSVITMLFSVAAARADLPVPTKLVIVSYFVSFLGFSLYLSWQLTAERYVTFLNATRAKLIEAAVREKGQQLAQIANTDHLTGLKNRRAVVQEYAAHRDRWLRGRQPIGVILIDVDYFKSFNDHYGHQTGDHCLVDVGQALELAASRSEGLWPVNMTGVSEIASRSARCRRMPTSSSAPRSIYSKRLFGRRRFAISRKSWKLSAFIRCPGLCDLERDFDAIFRKGTGRSSSLSS